MSEVVSRKESTTRKRRCVRDNHHYCHLDWEVYHVVGCVYCDYGVRKL